MPTAIASIRQKLPGVAEVLELENPGMHTSNRFDFASRQTRLRPDPGTQVLAQVA
jgi:hypothetical protein